MLNKVYENQIYILNKIKNFYKKNYFSSAYFCSYSNNLGFHIMNYWINKKNIKNFFYFFLKEIYSLLNMSDYVLESNYLINQSYKRIFLTWGNDKNIISKENKYYDKYFDIDNSDKFNLWIVIFKGKKRFNNENVILIKKKKLSFFRKLYNFFEFIFIQLKKKQISLHNLTSENFFSYKINQILNKILKDNYSSKNIFIPFEAQPFQNELVENIKINFKEKKIVGYIHSFPSFSPNLIKKKYSPDILISNSKNQIDFFCKYLDWNKNKLYYLPSLRFKKNSINIRKKKIYLPINFSSVSDICSKTEYLASIYNLKEFEVINHPEAYYSKQHNKLINNINNIINNKKYNKVNEIDFSIFIGSTSSIIESLSNGVKVIHLMENPVFEIYSEEIWTNIKVHHITKQIVKYVLLDENIINLVEKNALDQYLNID